MPPANSNANWASASQLAPGDRRMRTRGVAMKVPHFLLDPAFASADNVGCSYGTHPPLVRPGGFWPRAGLGFNPADSAHPGGCGGRLFQFFCKECLTPRRPTPKLLFVPVTWDEIHPAA